MPVRRMIAVNPLIEDLLAAAIEPRPVEVVRPDDLVRLTFSFVNLRFESGAAGEPPVLARRVRNRPAFVVVDCHAQHITEAALFEVAPNFPVTAPPPPLQLGQGTPAPQDPDAGKDGFDLTDPADLAALPVPPLFASLAGSSRLAFRVTTQAIPYTARGLIAAMGYLDLSVAPQAVPPRKKRRPTWLDLYASDAIDITDILTAANAPIVRATRARRRVESPEGSTRVTAELIALGRLQATAGTLEYRFGTDAAFAAAAGATIGSKLGIEDVIGELDIDRPIEVLPPPPTRPGPTQTAIELPWRLLISPNQHGAFAHSPTAVEHNGRFELWHSRLGVRAVDRNGKPILDDVGRPTVDEDTPDLRTIRAVWARDYDILPAVHPEPQKSRFRFALHPAGNNFPSADNSQDRPRERLALNSRDRMMLVHETANFHLLRNNQPGWPPEAVPTNRLMLTALGGWLDSRVLFDTLPDGGLTIEEWKHRAALGRDHEVKVVYSGFLLPFGHKASLVKITERKLASGPAGLVAYLFQRMFIIVREPHKQFRTASLEYLFDPDGTTRRTDHSMPLSTVRILTTVTPPLDEPAKLSQAASGQLFVPRVSQADFLFKLLAVDLENNIVEFAAPLVFMERDWNDTNGNLLPTALNAYNTSPLVDRRFDLVGQRVAYADSVEPDDTVLATRSMTFRAVFPEWPALPFQDEPRFLPVLEEAQAVVPAMSALAGAAAPTRLGYHPHFGANAFAGNAAQVFLTALDTPKLDFASQTDRSGGLVAPSLDVKALSRLTGPISGDVSKAITDPANFSVGGFFDNLSAKLFGLIPLKELFRAFGFDESNLPKFVSQSLDVATTLQQNAERIRNAANELAAHPGALGQAAVDLKTHVDTLLADLTALAADPTTPTPPDLGGDLGAMSGDLDPSDAGSFVTLLAAAPEQVLPRPAREQVLGLAHRLHDQLDDAAAVTVAAQALIQMAQGLKLPEVITARLDWSTEFDAWPETNDPPAKAIFLPQGPGHRGRLTLAVEVQAPTRPGKEPSALVSCSLTPFDLQLIAPVKFLILHFEVIEFSIVPGQKPDVNVKFREPNGIDFAGPLEFVNTLKDIIPFDGFSDPPYLDITAEGIQSGFDLSIPDLAVGVFALTNISLGAHFTVPFIDESIETQFNFCTRENPFRLSVALFAGGGFFGITITPSQVRVLEASFEFGAAIAVNLGVASGGVSIMAGIYFRLETDDDGNENAQLTGYFRLRGEVDVLGLISASIELYLEFTYETATGKAVGRATLTIEVEIFFFSFSVSITCEKKFAGSAGDPSFIGVMGLSPLAPPGAARPWDTYCHAFADD
ncbi:MAG: hypothetical protein ACRD29_14300 [Acidimicrobiales bacterium]